MQQIMKDATADAGTALYSQTINTLKSRTFGIQMIAKPADEAAACQAEGILEASNNKKQWVTIGTLKANGVVDADTGVASIGQDGGPFEALWGAMRFCLKTTVNCKVDVYLTKHEG